MLFIFKTNFKFGLRTKSVLIAFFCIILFITIFIFYIIPQQDQEDVEEIKKYTQRHLKTLAVVTVSPLLKKQYAALYEELNNQFHENPQWKYLSLVTIDGLVVYPLFPGETSLLLQNDISMETDIVFLDKILGKLHLIANISTELEARHKRYYQTIILLLIIIFLVLIIILLFIEKIITRPLITLTKAFKCLSQQDYSFELTYKNSDEVGIVIDEFREMYNKLHEHKIETDRLHQSQKELLETIRQSEQHLRFYREQSPIATIEWDINGIVLDWNKTAEKIFGYPIAEVRGKRFIDFIFSNENVWWVRLLEQLDISVDTHKNLTKDGKIIICEWHNTVLKDQSGTAIGVASLVLDITKRKQVEEKLQLAARVFNDAHEGIIITNSECIITDVNPVCCQITGYLAEEIIGKKPHILSSGKQDSEFYSNMWNTLNEQGYWQGEIWNKKKNGQLYAQMTVITSLLDADGNLLHYVSLFFDITHNMQQQELLETLAHYDPLTNLPNRILFADRFNQAISHSKRNNTLLVICFLDLDKFKPVNDTYGHKVGDQVLVEVASRITQCIREQDTVSRLGGDEFALLLGDISTVEQCKQTLARIHQAIESPFFIDGKYITIGASSGVTIYPQDNSDPDILLRHADQAMYQAKQTGRNRYNLFDITQDQEVTQKVTQKQKNGSTLHFKGNPKIT